MSEIIEFRGDTKRGPIITGFSACGGSGDALLKSYKDTAMQHHALSDYKTLVETGQLLPAMAYIKLVSKYTQYPGYQLDTEDDNFKCVKTCGPVPLATDIDSERKDEIRSNSVERLYEKIKSVDDFNMGTALVEIGKTANLITSTVTRIAGAFSSLRRGRITDAFRHLGLRDRQTIRGTSLPFGSVRNHRLDLLRRAPSSGRDRLYDFAATSWLELQYGWKPLLSDVYDGATAAGHGLQQRGDDLIFRSVDEARDQASLKDSSGSEDRSRSSTEKFTVSHSVALKVVDEKLRSLSALGLSNPLPLVWEVIPFSFIVDWFVPVQSFLENVGAFSGYSIVNRSRMEISSISYSTHVSNQDSEAWEPYFITGEDADIRRFVGAVNVPLSPPNPLSKLNNKLSPTKLTSALALARNIFLR